MFCCRCLALDVLKIVTTKNAQHDYQNLVENSMIGGAFLLSLDARCDSGYACSYLSVCLQLFIFTYQKS